MIIYLIYSIHMYKYKVNDLHLFFQKRKKAPAYTSVGAIAM